MTIFIFSTSKPPLPLLNLTKKQQFTGNTLETLPYFILSEVN